MATAAALREDAPDAAATAAANEERVSFANADGLRLAGIFVRGSSQRGGAAGSAAAGGDARQRERCCILCHGYASNKNDMALPDIAQVRAPPAAAGQLFDGPARAAGGGSEGGSAARGHQPLGTTFHWHAAGAAPPARRTPRRACRR